MAKIDFEKVKNKITEAADVVKTSVQEIDLNEVKAFGEKAANDIKDFSVTAAMQVKEFGENAIEQTKGLLQREAVEEEVVPEDLDGISCENCLKIYYYLMAIDGEITEKEKIKLDAIGNDYFEEYKEYEDDLLAECRECLESMADDDKLYDVIREGVEIAIIDSGNITDPDVLPKQLIWNLLTIAYSDDKYDDKERRLIKYVVDKLGIDEAVFLEMESSILTVADIEREIAWVKTTDKQYLEIEAIVNDLKGREEAIAECIMSLISL